MDEKYYPKNQEKKTPEIDSIEEYFWHAKTIVDLYEQNNRSRLSEKEIQQRVVYENNLSANADNTDYFIADVEWVNSRVSNGRADIVAFRWNHMEHRRREIQLTLIEVKQGAHAIQGKSGLEKHYADFCRFKDSSNFDEVAKDLLWVLWQKNKLELIKGLDKLFVRGIDKIKINPSPSFVFLLANYHHYSSALSTVCKDLSDDCHFIISSFMGYGLYKDFVRSKRQLIDEFPYVFSR